MNWRKHWPNFKRTEAALTFSTGYATAVGTIGALLGKSDIIILDKLVHASIVDAAKLSGAKMRIFDHNDLNDLEDKLKWAEKIGGQHRAANVGRAFSSQPNLFSAWMATPRHWVKSSSSRKNMARGSWWTKHMRLESSAKTDAALRKSWALSGQIEIQMGTLGKALGASGGYICGSRALIDLLVNRARSFIFSTATVPAAAAAATAGIQFVQSKAGEARNNLFWQRVKQLNSKLEIQNLKIKSAIIPILIGDETKAVAAAAGLRQQNIFVPAIRYPAVARGKARLRVTLTASHSTDDITTLVRALEQIVNPKS